MVTNFSFQATSQSDVERFKEEATIEGIPLRWGIEKEGSREIVPLRLSTHAGIKHLGAIEVHMQTSADLTTIREVMDKVPDSHVMHATLRSVQVVENH